MHLNSIDVSANAVSKEVGIEKEIGKVGGTGGYSPHLHFELFEASSHKGRLISGGWITDAEYAAAETVTYDLAGNVTSIVLAKPGATGADAYVRFYSSEYFMNVASRGFRYYDDGEKDGTIKVADLLAPQRVEVFGLRGDDRIISAGKGDLLSGGSGQDTLLGGGGKDQLFGDADDDILKGGAGNDQLNGGSGWDALNGGTGRDTLTGGTGRDILTGGRRADTFDFNSAVETKVGSQRDQITDFFQGADVIDLSDIDAKTGTGNQAFDFIGTQGFHSVKGELHARTSGANTIVAGDTNGDGVADFSILVAGVTGLTAGDFIL